MSTNIDQRVVEMRFDNKHFEKNVSTSMSTIDKLKQSLNMTGASKGLENVGSAVKNVNMSGLTSAVETVRLKFSALEVIAITALTNITNSAINAGKRIVSSLTVDPIKDGFQEYEMVLGAVQTTMAGTGKTMEEVERQLKRLDDYADETVYSTNDMLSNLPKFTNAGVELETATTAMIGIANATALAGGDARSASSAFYNLGQSIGTGYLTRMDYNSINNAGIATMEWKNQMVNAAIAQGTLTKTGEDAYEANGKTFTLQSLFIDGLQEQWAASDVLIKVFEDYGDVTTDIGKKAQASAQDIKTFTMMMESLQAAAGTGWKDTWQILFGNLEEAKVLWTGLGNAIGDMISKSAKARNDMLQGWQDLGGRTSLIEAFKNAFAGVSSVITPIKEAFRDIFPPTTAKQLFGITEGLRKFTAKLKLSDEASDNLKRTFKGLFAALDIVKQVFVAVFNAVGPLFGGIDDLGGGVLRVTASFGDWLVNLRDTIKETDILNKVVQGTVDFIKSVATAVKDFVKTIAEKFKFPGLEIFHKFLERVHTRMSGVGNAAGEMQSSVVTAIALIGEALKNSKFLKALQALWDGIKKISSAVAKAFKGLAETVLDKVGNADFEGVFDLFNTAALTGIALSVSNFVKSISGPLEGITGILDSVRGCFEAYQTKLKADALMKIAGAIAVLVAAIVIVSLIDSDKLTSSLGAITILFADLMGSMALFNKFGGSTKSIAKTTASMIAVSISILILASALKKIGELDAGQALVGVLGVAGLMTIMVATAKIMGKSSKTIIKGSARMVIFALAVKVLASACADLAELNWNELAKGLVGVGVLLAEISIFLNTVKVNKKSIATATGIVILASAIKILASACKDFAAMDWEDIKKGLVTIGLFLAEIIIFTKLTGNATNMVSTGIALIAMGAAMKIFASAIGDLSGMSWEELARGLTGMAGALLAVTVAMNFMPKNMISMGLGLIAVSTALVIMSKALENMGDMSWEELAKGLIVLGGSMAILAVGLNVMTGTLLGSAALIVAAGALAILTPVLSILGAMSWNSIVKGLVALAGTFTILGVAGLLLTPLVPTILALSASLLLIGVGVSAVGVGLLAAGAGLSALAIGFTALAGAGVAGATAIVASLSIIIRGVIGFIPLVLEQIGIGLIRIFNVIAEGAPALGAAVKAVILTLVDVLVECVPAIAKGALEMVAGVLKALVAYTPQIVDALFEFIIGVIDGIARNLSGLIKAVVNVFMSLFTGVIDALGDIDIDTLVKGIAGIGILSGTMLALSAVATTIPAAMVGVLGLGAVMAELAIVLAAVGAIAQIPGLKWLVDEGGKLMLSIGTAIGSFIGGIVGGVMSGVSSQFPKIGSDLSDFMTNVQPFIEGAKKIDSSVLTGVSALVGTVLVLTAANIIEGLTSWFTGRSSLVKFGEELAEFGPHFKSYYDSVKDIDGSVVTASANAAKSLSEMATNLPNQGGVVGWFAGENSLSKFADELADFGPKLKIYADSVKGMDTDVVVNSANAAKALAEMATNLPNQGGVVSWFKGDSSLSKFADELAKFGPVLKEYADSVEGLDADIIVNSANAAKALAELATNLPNQGGVVSWFTGDNTLSAFGNELAAFGPNLKAYSDSLDGMDSDVVVNSANAANSLAEMADNLPNQGGVVSWFTGSSSISKFGEELSKFGPNFMSYYDSIQGMDGDVVEASANAAKSLGEMAENLPEKGGISEWFTGSSSITKFGEELASFGPHLKEYSDSVKGIDPAMVESSANAAKVLSEMADTLPEKGGIVDWFTGSSSITDFGEELAKFGPHLKLYSDSVQGVDAGMVEASSNAAKVLAEMADTLPNQGGLLEWFTGSSSINTFGEELVKFGPNLKEYADSISGLDATVVTNSATAAKALAELADTLPNTGGVVSWFTGDNDIGAFGKSLIIFGKNFAEYSDYMKTVDSGVVASTSNAAESLVKLQASLPETGGWFSKDMDLSDFGSDISAFGSYFSEYYSKVSNIKTNQVNGVIESTNRIVSMAKGMSEIDPKGMSSFGKNLTELAKAGITEFIKAFTDAESRITASSKTLIDTFISGMQSKNTNFALAVGALINQGSLAVEGKYNSFVSLGNTLMSKFIDGVDSRQASTSRSIGYILKACITSIKSKYTDFKNQGERVMAEFIKGIKLKDTSVSKAITTQLGTAITNSRAYYNQFYSAGSYLVDGFASGISANVYKAEAKARAMASAAARAAERELDEHSPSRVFYDIGDNAGLGFVNALSDYGSKSYKASSEMADSAKRGLSSAISKITDIINSDIDTQPTIRPVMDLTDIKSGSRELSSIFNENANLLTGSRSTRLAGSINTTQQQTSLSNTPVTASGGINNEFKIANLTVREESDVKKIARQLYQLQLAGSRG